MSGLFSGSSLERPVTCEWCHKTHGKCTCPRNAAGKVTLPKDQHPRVRREKRRGKFVTVIAELDLKPTYLVALGKELRSSLGTGGTVTKSGEVELQGDHRDHIVALLKERGYQAKPAGG